MSKLSLPLLAIALAVALSAPPLSAQQITTSKGVRTLQRPDPQASESHLRQTSRSAEEVVLELLADIAAIDSTYGSAAGDADSLSEKVKRENAEYERAKTAFAAIDTAYREDLARFQQRQAQLDADLQRQRSEAAVLQELPSAQRDINEVMRLNDWAAKLTAERQAMEGERTRLLADHDRVEAERAKLAKQRTDAEAKLAGMRDSTVGQLGGVAKKREAAYKQLSVATAYLRGVRDQWSRVSKTKLARSEPLERATTWMQAYEARRPAGR